MGLFGTGKKKPEDYLKRYTTLEEVEEAILALAEMKGSANIIRAILNGETGWNRYTECPLYNPIMQADLVKLAINSLKNIEHGASAIALIAVQEKRRHREIGRDAKDIPTHEDFAIAAILSFPPEEAAKVLSDRMISGIGDVYPEKVAKALATLDTALTVSGISSIASGCRPDAYERNDYLSSAHVQTLHTLVDVNERVKSGDVENITTESIRCALELNCAALLEVQGLLKTLKGYEDYDGTYVEPISNDAIGEVRSVLGRIEDSGITEKRYTSLFNDIVKQYEAAQAAEVDLAERVREITPIGISLS